MPSREYYLEDNAKMKAHRAAYRDYIVTIEKLAGLPGGEAAADRIIALETALSKVQWPAADRRDIDKIYNPMTRAQLTKLAPQFDWNRTLVEGGLGNAKTVIVTEPSAVAGAGKILVSTPLSTWKEWLAFRFVSDHAACFRRRSTMHASPFTRRSFGRSRAARALEARCRRGQWRARRGRRRKSM